MEDSPAKYEDLGVWSARRLFGLDLAANHLSDIWFDDDWSGFIDWDGMWKELWKRHVHVPLRPRRGEEHLLKYEDLAIGDEGSDWSDYDSREMLRKCIPHMDARTFRELVFGSRLDADGLVRRLVDQGDLVEEPAPKHCVQYWTTFPGTYGSKEKWFGFRNGHLVPLKDALSMNEGADCPHPFDAFQEIHPGGTMDEFDRSFCGEYNDRASWMKAMSEESGLGLTEDEVLDYLDLDGFGERLHDRELDHGRFGQKDADGEPQDPDHWYYLGVDVGPMDEFEDYTALALGFFKAIKVEEFPEFTLRKFIDFGKMADDLIASGEYVEKDSGSGSFYYFKA